ncbi:MAG: hypothetical protein U5L96_08540 [Owenweeksia sp.]|nr:hypothetical protein [Owenweeksia sp.]
MKPGSDYASMIEWNNNSWMTLPLRYAYRFSLQDSGWVRLDRMREILPLDVQSPASFLEETQYFEKEDSTNLYLLEVIDYKLKGGQGTVGDIRVR